MAFHRRRRGFERVGDLPAHQLGLPLGRARELVLQRVWREVAGELIARQAPVEGVRRGVLEIRLPDGPWGRILPDLLPQLAGRLAAGHPTLAVTGYRLLTGGSAAAQPAHPLPTVL